MSPNLYTIPRKVHFILFSYKIWFKIQSQILDGCPFKFIVSHLWLIVYNVIEKSKFIISKGKGHCRFSARGQLWGIVFIRLAFPIRRSNVSTKNERIDIKMRAKKYIRE